VKIEKLHRNFEIVTSKLFVLVSLELNKESKNILYFTRVFEKEIDI